MSRYRIIKVKEYTKRVGELEYYNVQKRVLLFFWQTLGYTDFGTNWTAYLFVTIQQAKDFIKEEKMEYVKKSVYHC